MSNCFKVSNTVRCLSVKGALKEYPWEKEANPDLKEGLWILVHRDVKTLHLIYNETV